MIDKWLEKAQSLRQEETLRTFARESLGLILCSALVFGGITTLLEMLMGNWTSTETSICFSVALVATLGLYVLRDRERYPAVSHGKEHKPNK